MRKLLTALFLCLMISPAALAEDDLFTDLCGLWTWNAHSPETPLGGGVYFHVDGTCALYDAAAFDSYHTDMVTRLTFREEGTWSVEGDTLMVSIGEALYTFLAQARTREEWAYYDGMYIGGGAYHGSGALEMDIPIESVVLPAVLEQIRAAYPWDKIEGYAESPNAPGGPMAFALIHDGDRRMLLGYQLVDGQWRCWLQNTKAIPQIDMPNVSLGAGSGGGAYSQLWYDEDRHEYVYPDGPSLSVWTDNGESHEERVTFVWQEDGFKLVHYGDSPGCMVDVAGNQLVIYNIGDDTTEWKRFSFDTDISTVDFYALPRWGDDAADYVPADPAAAEGAADVFAELSGLWTWVPQSPETPLGGGVYLHVDGTCALYDMTGTDGEFVDALTFREAGTWTATGNTLTITTADGTSAYTTQRLTWQDWDYNDGMRIGEGNFLPAAALNMGIPIQSVIPEAILEYVLAFSWYDVIEDYAELPGADGGPMAFVLIRNEERRKLDIFQLKDGVWECVEDAESSIPQIDLPHVFLSVSREGGSYENSLWYDPYEHDYVYPAGPTLSITTGDGEVIRESVTFVLQGDTFCLTHYSDGPNDLVDVVDDQLVFYNISGPDVQWAKYEFDTDIRTASFYSLPREIADIRITGMDEPDMPVTDWDNALLVQDVKLRTGKKYPVYMGPGKQYGRAANSKASVSTNGWVQVFGEYDGWLLVHYAISAEQYRFGWITADALARGETVAELPLTFGDRMNNSVPLTLTDDPLNSRTALAELPEGTNMERLARLGDGYALVRVEIGGKTWWGFVYAWALGHG